jgi:hypothetical protein
MEKKRSHDLQRELKKVRDDGKEDLLKLEQRINDRFAR